MVEQETENLCVAGSIPALDIRHSYRVVLGGNKTFYFFMVYVLYVLLIPSLLEVFMFSKDINYYINVYRLGTCHVH